MKMSVRYDIWLSCSWSEKCFTCILGRKHFTLKRFPPPLKQCGFPRNCEKCGTDDVTWWCNNNNNNNNNWYSALWPVWQEPEPSQVTGMALIRCILGKFLGVVCHCFPFSFRWHKGPNRAQAASLLRFLDHTELDTFTHKHTHTVRLLSINDQPVTEAATYTTHSKHNRTSMPLAGFEPAIPAVKWLQNYALDRTVTGIGNL